MISVRTSVFLVAALGLAACVDPPLTEGPDASVGPDAADPQVSVPDEPADYDTIELMGEACTPRACTATECGMVDDGCRAQMWCGECPCSTSSMSCERNLTQIWEQTLGPGTYTIIATQAIPDTLDAVMHVISATGTEYAWDDNSAGGNRPRVTVTVPAGQQRIVVLRPKTDTTTGGAAIVTINGQQQIMGVRGRRQVYTNLRANEEIETVELPGSDTTHIIYGMSADGEHITQRVEGNGTAGGAVLTQPAAASSRVFWIGAWHHTQRAAVLRNDRRLSGHDAEAGGGDGLGYELEAAIGTCTSPFNYATNPKDNTAFPCSWAVDLRDTDGDGISDGDEVRGIRTTANAHQPLRRWGADPRHKDLFVEVDGAKRNATETPPKMTPAQARYFSDVYGDRLVPLTAQQKGEHANTLRNPDQRPGISVHMDIGIQAESPADYTVYGNWGGYSQTPPSGNAAMDPQAAWPTYLSTGRKGVFRYASVYLGGGGQTSTSATCPGCGSYAWTSGADSAAVMAHEAGHAHAIAHSGPAGISPIVDPNCKANWPSIMSYAFQNAGVGFADGTGLGTLNNVGVSEVAAVSPWNTTVIDRLRTKFKLRVDASGDVDWNRDGVISSQPVRAYTNFEPGTACEYTRYNAQWISTQMNTALAPALARLGNTSFMFAGGTTQLRYVSSTSDFDCAINENGCGSWGNYGTFALDTTRGVDAARVTDANGRQALVIVGADAQGWVHSTMRLDDGTWSPVQWTGIWGISTGEPAIETLPDGRALLVYKQSDGTMLYGIYRYTGGNTGSWERWGPAMACADGSNLTVGPVASPGLAATNFTGFGAKVYGLFSTDVALYVRQFDVANTCWSMPDVPLSGSVIWPVQGRPAGAWVPDATNAMGGRLTVIGTTKSADPNGRYVQQLWSYVDVTNGPRIGQQSGFDSFWTWSFGVDAWYDAGIDDNLRVVWSVSPSTSAPNGQRLRFFPRADGINDFPHVPYNDWQALNYAVCFNLAAQQGSSKINCPARPW